MRLLMVEDEEKLAQLVKRALVAERFSVDVAHDGRHLRDKIGDPDQNLIRTVRGVGYVLRRP